MVLFEGLNEAEILQQNDLKIQKPVFLIPHLYSKISVEESRHKEFHFTVPQD